MVPDSNLGGGVRLSSDELRERANRLAALADPCRLCPRLCGVARGQCETGWCGATLEIEVASYGPHFGEERVLVGPGGSGTIFFTHCNLGCSFCQNHDISQGGRGRVVTAERLAGMMLELERLGCANVNLVTPSHYVAGVLAALAVASDRGLDLPIVYNCGGYESTEVLALLDGAVDVYMPDAKFGAAAVADELCRAPDYPDVMVAALAEMQRQVGDLEVEADGLASRGLLVRHLVMPGDLASTGLVLESIAAGVSPTAAVNVMDQYRPCFRAVGASGPIGRTLGRDEHRRAVAKAASLGLRLIS